MENDTPRTQIRREVRQKRLAYYDNTNQPSTVKSLNNRFSRVKNGPGPHPSTRHNDLRRPNSSGYSRSMVSREIVEKHQSKDVEEDTANQELKPDNFQLMLLDANETSALAEMDTSRTSDILMETSRDFREILREREALHSKSSSQVPASAQGSSKAAPVQDLSSRSVTEVLKVLEERAQRRRELPRLSDLSDSGDDEEDLSDPVEVKDREEHRDKAGTVADSWVDHIRHLTNLALHDQKTANAVGDQAIRLDNPVHANTCFDPSPDMKKSSHPEVDGLYSVYSRPESLPKEIKEKLKTSSLPDTGASSLTNGVDHTVMGDLQMIQQEAELERQHSSILQKILHQSNCSQDFLTSNVSVPKSFSHDLRNHEDNISKSNLSPKFAPMHGSSKAKVAFSVDEIISQAGAFASNRPTPTKKSHQTTNGISTPSVHKEDSSPVRRSVHFDCPPTPSDVGLPKEGKSMESGSSSIDTRSSASVVSLMSIRDVADRLEELGINPHLLGIQLTGDSNNQPEDKQPRWKKTKQLVRICPKCGKCNSETISWCLNCSCVLIGIEPQPLPKRRNRRRRTKSTSSLMSSTNSSKGSTISSAELDHSNNSNKSSVTEPEISDIEGEKMSEPDERVNHLKAHFDEKILRNSGYGDPRSSEVNQKFNLNFPSSIYDDDLESLTSPMVSAGTEQSTTPAAVWDPKQMNVAQLLVQSRALLNDPGTPTTDSPSKPAWSSNPPILKQETGTQFKKAPVLQSTESIVSISLATPSPNRPNVPGHILEDLKLDLISSSVEDSPGPRVKNSVQDIAVLDPQDVLALKETSSGSVKPDSIPQLSLPGSPTSTVDGHTVTTSIADDMKVDVCYQDMNFRPTTKKQVETLPCQATQNASKECSKPRREFSRRPNSAANASVDSHQRVNRGENNRRRPLSSTQQQPGPRRRWKNSSLAWSNYHPSQLKKKPAEYVVQESLNASKSKDFGHQSGVSFLQSNGTVLRQGNNSSVDDSVVDNKSFSSKPANIPPLMTEEPGSRVQSDEHLKYPQSSIEECSSTVKDNPSSSKPLSDIEETESIGLSGSTIEYLKQRGWQSAYESPWLYLADEVWLRIFSFLSPKDLSSGAATCKRLHRVANDSSLWRWPVVKRKHDLTEEELFTIGSRRPISLKLKQCKGQNVTLPALRTFFNMCSSSLRKFCFSGCNHGAFSEDQFILLAALFCPQLTSVDISFAHGVRDSTLRALAEGCDRLECVRFNGAQHVTDSGIKFLTTMHGESLRKLELYGCFAITSQTVRELSKNCVSLTHTSFGSCNRISSSALVHFASHRRENLKQLDLRGLHSVLDSTITAIVAVCPSLESLWLSNCGSVSNVSIRAIANHCLRLRRLDVCGCNQVGSDSAQELVRKCKHLEELDFSSTCVDHKTVTCLAHTWTPKLKCLRLNFCCNLKEDGIFKLCSNSKSLCVLYLYGIRNFGVSFFNRLRKEYPRIEVKSDDSLEGHDG